MSSTNKSIKRKIKDSFTIYLFSKASALQSPFNMTKPDRNNLIMRIVYIILGERRLQKEGGAMHPEPIPLILADDHPLTRAGIREILSAARDILVVGEAQNGAEARELVAALHPRILLLDLKMPGDSPVEIERWVRQHSPETVTLVLTAHDRDFYLSKMMEAGVAGYLSKSERAENLIAAIRRAAAGEALFTEEQIARSRRWREQAGDKWDSLTGREREVLRLATAGLSNRAMAEKLGVTPKTVAFHLSTILDKLGLRSRYEAAAWLHKYFPDDLTEV